MSCELLEKKINEEIPEIDLFKSVPDDDYAELKYFFKVLIRYEEV